MKNEKTNKSKEFRCAFPHRLLVLMSFIACILIFGTTRVLAATDQNGGLNLSNELNNAFTEQSKTITGSVKTKSGDPIPGVTIVVTNTNVGTITDEKGNYSIKVSAGSTLTFSFIGMTTVTENIDNRSVINVELDELATAIGEVVAIGYGTQTKREISGSVTNVTSKEFSRGVATSAADLLQGKVAGLNITSGSGDVTSPQTIRLRGTSSLTGSSSPFVVIDGVPGGDLNTIAPTDIESISVLKDASSAAIYGSRSASGVILITTKKGSKSQTKVNYEGYVSVSKVSNKPDILSADEWRQYAKDHNKDTSGFDLGADTDWFGEILRTGVTQNHSLSFSGGGDTHNYMASISYMDMEGVSKDNNLNRLNMRFSLNQYALQNRLLLTFTGNSVVEDNNPTNNQNFNLAYNSVPVAPVILPNGEYYENFDADQGNAVKNIKLNRRDNKINKYYGNIKADFEITKGFNATASAFRERITNDWGLYNNSTTQAGRQSQGYAQRQSKLWDRNLYEITLRYKHSFNGLHNISALAGYSWEENNYRYFGAQNRQFGTDLLGYDNLQAGESLNSDDVYSNRNMSRLISGFGRFTYNYMEKYVLAATVRRDGSSKFGANNKWGTFPSFSAAWNISKEDFMSNLSVVNDLKLRTGYGVTGNQDGIGPYNSLNLYGAAGQYWNDGKWYTAYGVTQNANPNLKWEKTAMLNIGLDYALFDSRISGTIEWYDKETSNLLFTYSVPVPPFQYDSMLANVGTMNNKGIELILNAIPVKTKDFQWNITLNAAHNKNMITELSNSEYKTDRIKVGDAFVRGGGNTTTHIIEVGHEVGTFYGWQSTGIDANGKYIITDIEPDGVINDKDMTYLGSAQPKLTYSINNSFTYKNWDLSAFIRGVYGNKVLNYTRLQFGTTQWLMGANVLREALTLGLTDAPVYNSFYIEDGSFVRLDYLNLGYTVKGINPKWVKNLRLYVTGQNLFTLTKYNGLDPEVDMSGLHPGVEQRDYYPKSRSFMMGVNVSF